MILAFILILKKDCANALTVFSDWRHVMTRSLITEVWNVLQESTIRYVSNTMFLPLIVRYGAREQTRKQCSVSIVKHWLHVW